MGRRPVAGRAVAQAAGGASATDPSATDRSATDASAADPSPTDASATEVDGLYGPGSEAWRLNREAALLLVAGPRALLLQVAHPLVAEGVDQHSRFREDPWARLEATISSYLAIVYGTRSAGLHEIARLNRMHRAIAGPVREPAVADRFGPTYQARDPDLSLWVHATLVDSTLVGYEAIVEPLTRDRRARFYVETVPVARAFGIPDERIPPDLDAFEAYLRAMLAPAGPVHPTDAARSIADAILHPPLGPLLAPLGLVPAAAYDWTMWPAVGLLPPAIREEYAIAWGPLRATVAGWLVAAWRAWRPVVPASLRWMPQARAADARVARRAAGSPRA